MNESQPPAEPYEAPIAEDVELVGGTTETAHGNVSQTGNVV